MKLQSLSIEERAMLLSMLAPPSASDLPGELVADSLERRDGVSYRKLLAAEMITIGIPPQPPPWVWGHYAEQHLNYYVRLDQYDPAVIAADTRPSKKFATPLSFRNIVTITQRGWDALALTPETLPRPGWA